MTVTPHLGHARELTMSGSGPFHFTVADPAKALCVNRDLEVLDPSTRLRLSYFPASNKIQGRRKHPLLALRRRELFGHILNFMEGIWRHLRLNP